MLELWAPIYRIESNRQNYCSIRLKFELLSSVRFDSIKIRCHVRQCRMYGNPLRRIGKSVLEVDRRTSLPSPNRIDTGIEAISGNTPFYSHLSHIHGFRTHAELRTNLMPAAPRILITNWMYLSARSSPPWRRDLQNLRSDFLRSSSICPLFNISSGRRDTYTGHSGHLAFSNVFVGTWRKYIRCVDDTV